MSPFETRAVSTRSPLRPRLPLEQSEQECALLSAPYDSHSLLIKARFGDLANARAPAHVIHGRQSARKHWLDR